MNTLTKDAARDLSSYQYCIVYITDDDTVDFCGANGRAVGILQNKPDAAGEACKIAIVGSLSRIKMNEAAAVGKLITSTSAGLGEIADAAGEWCVGQMWTASAAQNDIAWIIVNPCPAHASDA